MTLITVLDALFPLLVRASIDGALFVLGAVLLLRLAPGVPAWARALVWWLACVRFLVTLASPVAVPLAIVPAGWAGTSSDVAAPTGVTAPAASEYGSSLAASPDHVVPTASSAPALPTRQDGPVAQSVSPGALAAAVWLCGVLILLARGACRAARLFAHVREAQPADGRVRHLAGEAGARIGLARTVDVRVSSVPSPPHVVWCGRPVVLLSARDAGRLDDEDLALLLAHEMVHVRRRDAAWAWLPALSTLLFAFHPLARLAAREFVVAREAACDAEVLERLDAAPRRYGQLLLRLGVWRGRPLPAPAGTSTNLSALKRRLIMLERWSPQARRLTARGALVLVLLGIAMVPLQLTASRAASPPADSPEAIGVVAPVPDVAPVDDAEEPQAAPPAPPAPPVPPVPPAPPAPEPWSHPKVVVNGAPLDGWAMFGADGDRFVANWGDRDRLESLRHGGPAFWFRLGGKEYVIRDAALLEELERTFEPMHRIGRRQGDVGRRQGAIGREQGAIGREQARVAREHARAARAEARRAIEQARRDLHASTERARAERNAKRSSLDAELSRSLAEAERELAEAERSLRKEIEEDLRTGRNDDTGDEALARSMEELAREMAELGRQMAPLAEEQRALAAEMREASAETWRSLGAILARALASGAAQAVKE